MGSNNGEHDETPVHSVTLKNYSISKYEITFDQYETFCEATGRNKPEDVAWGRGKRPVININWNDAAAFCKWLSQETGENIHLPTEAQWEYAAREGHLSSNHRYSGSDDVNAVAWHAENSEKVTHPVGEKYPNALGIFDMSGNVFEWCRDWYDKDYYVESPKKNPQGPASGYLRVIRGGSWYDLPSFLRCTNRDCFPPFRSFWHIGFRIVREQSSPLLTDCTGFVFSDGQTVYAGGNEDFREKDFHIWFEPAANKNEYGSVFIGHPIWEGKYHAFHGMNTAGLYHDSFGGAQKELKGMKELPEYDGDRSLHEDVMMKNATVKEAIKFMGHYYHQLYKTDMSLFGDATGNAAVKEGDVVVAKNGDFMVLTNFMLSQVKSPMTVCDRYRITTNMLNENKKSLDLARAILSTTHNEGLWSTKYSVICDLTHKIMYIYYFHDFEEVYVLDLEEELKKGKRRFPLKDLFSEKYQEKIWTMTYKNREQNEEVLINYLGYNLLQLELFDEAISVLKVNTKRHPDSWNSWDSLAEAYYRKGDMESAIKHYQKSIALNPENENAKEKLKEIKEKDK